MRWDEVVARDPSVKAAMTGKYAEEQEANLALVRRLPGGKSPESGRQAAESWLIAAACATRRSPDESLSTSEAPADWSGGPGQRPPEWHPRGTLSA
ncbi:hypothetical protein HBB16_02510 [Pseudonocardia sp. MCCB 268]|nr:hypothetical protein [Pseudonocardia cytotoxica]